MNDQEKSLITLGARGLQLSTFDELYRFSEFVVKAGFYPRGLDSKEKVFLALQYGMELGLSPMTTLQNSMVVNNRPSIYGELVLGIVQSHPDYQDMGVQYFGEGEDYGCEVTLIRRGQSPSVGKFTVRQAEHLIKDPNKKDTWGKYVDDMLFWRAFTRAKRIFSDRLKGVVMPHELEDQADGVGFENARNVTPPAPPAKPEMKSESAEAMRAKREIEKAREAAQTEATKISTNPVSATTTTTQSRTGEPPEPGPFDHPTNPLETVIARLKKAGVTHLAFLKILAANRVIEPAVIDRGLNAVPHQALKNALDDWDEVMSQVAQERGK
jgi:hypothetical protein